MLQIQHSITRKVNAGRYTLKHENRAFTVEPRSLISVLIATVTGQPFTHAAFCVDGVWYDASESRGNFGRLNKAKFKNRFCLIATLPDRKNDPLFYSTMISRMLNVDYDYSGVVGWIFGGQGNRKKFYCFEAVLIFLSNHFRDADMVIKQEGRVSGLDIFNFRKFDWKAQRGLNNQSSNEQGLS